MILLVDDDDGFLDHAKRVLSKEGPVMLARDAAHTRSLMESIAFDVVLVDLNLPDCNGFQLIEELCAARPEVPIVAFSGVASRPVLESATAMGAVAVLRKPASDEWSETVRRVLRLRGNGGE